MDTVKAEVDGSLRSYVAANEGAFECIPPESEEGTWEIKQILDEASSDMAFADFDNDGELEMLTISPSMERRSAFSRNRMENSRKSILMKKMLNSLMESGVERSQELRVF